MTMQTKDKLFPTVLIPELISKVAGESAIVKLSQQKPIPFNGSTEFVFSMDSDIDVVAENGKKSHGGIELTPVKIVPIKVEYGARVSDEFLYATEEGKINILQSFVEGYAKKLAKGLDIMAFHGVNPRTGTASTVIGDNNFDTKVTQTVEFDATTGRPDEAIETAIETIQGAEGTVSGMALDTQMSSALAKLTIDKEGKGVRLFPELAWGANPGVLNGVPTQINKTVANGKDDLAIIGDFASSFKWGFAKEIPLEIIQYGDPDNSGNDLKGYNQVYLRSETFLGWGILNADSFARVTKKAGA